MNRLGKKMSGRVIRLAMISCMAFVLMPRPGVRAEKTTETTAPLDYDWGFVAARYRMVNGALRTRALGPFFESVKMPEDGADYLGIRPFYARVDQPDKRMRHTYGLWPLSVFTRHLHEFKWRVLLAYGRKGQVGDENSERYRFNIFPVYFQSRDQDGKLHVAVFPLGGTIRGMILYERITFLLFPLWMNWESQDVESRNFLWPLIASTRSKSDERVRRFRVLPFYARSEYAGKYYKKSVMWPFWTWSRFYPERSKGYAYVVWPLFGRINRESEKGWLVLPPFFRFTSGEEGRLINAPWPFVQYRKTKYLRKFYLWPLYGRRDVKGQTRRFFLWPFIWHRTIDFQDRHVQGLTIVPFLMNETIRARQPGEEPGEVTHRYTKCWPFFLHRRAHGVRQTRIPELWPFPESQGVEQTWAPFWSLFSHTVVEGKGYDSELLWGLYRQQVVHDSRRYNALFPLYSYERDENINEGKKEWTFLKGLFGYKREFGIRRYRLLYFINFGGKREIE